MGDRAIRGIVLGDIRIQEQQRHSADVDLPDRHRDIASRELDGDLHLPPGGRHHPPDRQLARLELGVDVLLVAVQVDLLTEVAMLVEEAHRHERNPEVGGGLEVISGQDSQAARVERDRLVDTELRTEVRDGVLELGARSVIPRGVAVHVAVEACHRRGIPLQDGLARGEDLPALAVDGVDQVDRVVVLLPGGQIEGGPEFAGVGRPGPPQIVGEVDDPSQLLWDGEFGIGKGGDRRERHARLASGI